MSPVRAWILLPSGSRLDLLAPDPWAWTDRDLAIGLSRTYRWAGYSAWDLPLSVAQHSLTVLALCRGLSGVRLTAAESLRELLHDSVEALMGGWDPITPIKPHLGEGYALLVARLQAAVDAHYALPAWTADSHARHKRADRLAAASEAFYVVGWDREAMSEHLGIVLEPVAKDPLPTPPGLRPWEPWPPKIAQRGFLAALHSLSAAAIQRGGDGSHHGAEIQAASCRGRSVLR